MHSIPGSPASRCNCALLGANLCVGISNLTFVVLRTFCACYSSEHIDSIIAPILVAVHTSSRAGCAKIASRLQNVVLAPSFTIAKSSTVSGGRCCRPRKKGRKSSLRHCKSNGSHHRSGARHLEQRLCNCSNFLAHTIFSPFSSSQEAVCPSPPHK